MRKMYSLLIMIMLTGYISAQQAGDLDLTFGEDGLVYFPNEERIKNVKAQPDGKILALGDSILYRLNADGTTDTSFGNNGIITIECPLSNIDIMPDGEHIIVQVATSCDSTNNNLKVYDVSGNLVNEITISGCIRSPILISSDRMRLLDCDGNIRDQNIFDSNDFFTFPDGVPVTGESRYVIMAQGEGYTITLGATPTVGYDPMNLYINKITDDSLTTEWTYSEVFSGAGEFDPLRLNIYDVLIQSNGKILYYYGHTDSYNPNRYIKRLNTDGSVDYTFNTITFWGAAGGAGCDCLIPQDIALNSHDEIIISFYETGFIEHSDLKLYDKDGSYISSYAGYILANFIEDTSFYLENISVQTDNSVLVAGIEAIYLFSDDKKGFIAKFTPVCPSGRVVFTSQEQIDNFSITYPNCDRISGDVIVSSDSINNLSGLSNIRFIDGNFEIYDNPLLEQISMEHNLEVGGDVIIRNNDALQTAFPIIKFNGGLYIEDNDVLYDISYLDYLSNSEQLTHLKIANNPSLIYCISRLLDFTGPFCWYLYNDRSSDIYNNASPCNSAEEIMVNCDYLPIELTDFQAQVQNTRVLLTWETATETNNEGFEIQRSKDGTTWEKIAWQAGQGTSIEQYKYKYIDTNPLFGTSYYKLKQIDFDGNYSYSDIVKINYIHNGINIYPNPVKNTVYLADTNGKNIQYITIYDHAGRQIMSQNATENTIDVSSLSSGMYIIKIAFESGVFCEKLIIE